LLQALDTPPDVSVYLNEKKCRTDLFFNDQPVPWCAAGRFLPERPSFTFDPHFQAGCYYVMESSSMFLSHVIQEVLDPGDPVCALDLCAAPGGKSTILLSTLPRGSLLVANEVNRSRFNILQHNLDKWGHSGVAHISKDPSRLPWHEQFDLILVDAPCSGEGLFRKDHDARTHWSPENVALCSARQRRILHEALRLLKPGGRMIYSTCTFNATENIDQVCWLAETYRLESLSLKLEAGWSIEILEKNGQTGYQFFPHKVRGEGFFCAVMVKPGISSAAETISGKRRSAKGVKDATIEYPDWLDIPVDRPDVSLERNGTSSIGLIQTDINTDFLAMAPGVMYGTEIGQGQGKSFAPAHGLALSMLLKNEFPAIRLEEGQAISYLRKEPIDAVAQESGWNVVRYNGYNLGWAKQTGAGLKNYFPTHLRIRQSG
jgi:16S rRNA C967 or C1407 C5-methylase (RsmB/RsmF family)/NOL1/NOP2/fmu family ribosome biogenesis protein